jgi:predicted membrane protein
MLPDSSVAVDNRGPRVTPQLLLGLFVVAIGILFTLQNMGLLDAEDYLKYWPVVLVAIGLVKLWQSKDGSGGTFSGLLLTVAGTWLLLENAAVVRISFWELWPLLLVFFGGYLIWQGVSAPRARIVPDQGDTVMAVAIVGGVSRGNNSRSFKGGDLTAIMGGCELDLRQAAIDGEAVVDVFAMWGGIEIRVPDDWTVIVKAVPLMGGIEDKTRPPQGVGRHRLVIRGFVIMAGVEIKN